MYYVGAISNQVNVDMNHVKIVMLLDSLVQSINIDHARFILSKVEMICDRLSLYLYYIDEVSF